MIKGFNLYWTRPGYKEAMLNYPALFKTSEEAQQYANQMNENRSASTRKQKIEFVVRYYEKSSAP